jgi:hypothetical protein
VREASSARGWRQFGRATRLAIAWPVTALTLPKPAARYAGRLQGESMVGAQRLGPEEDESARAGSWLLGLLSSFLM